MNAEYAAYYETLGLMPGADPAEVKKAYFALIRQFPPEQDPESFKRIRTAYEALKDAPPLDDGGFPRPDTPLLQPAIDYCLQELRDQNYGAASRAFAKLLDYAPDDPWILLNLAQAQKLDGHPQKAVNTARKLLKTHPDCREAATLEAVAMHERGWHEKAWPAFQKAYELGERSLPFMSAYVSAALKKWQENDAIQAAHELLENTKWTRTNLNTALDVFTALGDHPGTAMGGAESMLAEYEAFLKKHRRLLTDLMHTLAPVAAVLSRFTGPFGSFFGFPTDVYKQADSLLVFLSGVNDEWAEKIRNIRTKMVLKAMHDDDRLDETDWQALLEAAILFPEEEEITDQDVLHYAKLDAELCVLKDPKSRKTAKIIRDDYPLLYEADRAFVDCVASGDTEEAFALRKKDFLRIYKRFTGSEFLRRYPDEEPKIYHEVKVHEGDQPFVRSGKKIGRNDPCPCGSGKKFKRCCMGKGIYD